MPAGILAAIDRVPATLGLHGADGRRAATRAKAVSEGDWASKALRSAVEAAVSATMTATIVTTV